MHRHRLTVTGVGRLVDLTAFIRPTPIIATPSDPFTGVVSNAILFLYSSTERATTRLRQTPLVVVQLSVDSISVDSSRHVQCPFHTLSSWTRPLFLVYGCIFTARCYAERGYATVSPSVCNVQVPWSHRLECFENNSRPYSLRPLLGLTPT